MGQNTVNHIPKGEKLGEILIKRKLIARKQLNAALRKQKEQHGFLGEILTDMGYVSEKDIVIALVVQCHFPYIAVDRYEINHTIINLIPPEVAVKFKIIPLDRVGRVLSVVMQNPLDLFIRRELRKITDCDIFPFIATRAEIKRAMERWYNTPA